MGGGDVRAHLVETKFPGSDFEKPADLLRLRAFAFHPDAGAQPTNHSPHLNSVTTWLRGCITRMR